MIHDLDPQVAKNLIRWQASGEPDQWVHAHQGQWDHADWLELLANLEQAGCRPIDPEAVGAILEESRRLWGNLQRWEAGPARAWVEIQQGQWTEPDWQQLVGALRESEFWPLDVQAAHDVLDRLTAEWGNLQRWQRSIQPRLWVETHEGRWDHADWEELLEALRQSQFWPMNPDAVGRVLEEAKQQYQNFHRWQESGEPLRWVQAHQGRWDQQEWLDLAARLEKSAYWPLDLAVVEAALEELPRRAQNLQRWQECGAARAWINARQGRWSDEEWRQLLASLQQSPYWPMDVEAIPAVLRALNFEWWNLHRWCASGLARQWVEQRQGRGGPGEFLAVMHHLQRTEFWPVDSQSVREALEEIPARHPRSRGRPELEVQPAA